MVMNNANRLFSSDQYFRYRPSHTLPVLLALVLLLCSNLASAATASVSSNRLAKEEVFQLKIVADERLDRDSIDFTPLEQDFFTGTPHFGFYSNSINGQKSVRSEWTIALAPLRAGIITIPVFQVGSSQTAPIQLTVSRDPTAITQHDLVEVQVKLDKHAFYLGELNRLQTRVIVKADSRQIQSASITAPSVQSADSQAFSLEPLGEEQQYQTIIDGVAVIVVDKTYRVTASQPGKFVLNGPSFKGAILDNRQRSGSRIVPIDTKPEVLVVSVLDKPAGYQGTWLPSSELTLVQRWFDESGQEIKSPASIKLTAGSPITREITLTAKGVDSTMLPNLNIDYPEAVRVYPETPQLSQQEDNAQMVVKQVLIGKQPGDITLPAISLAWWNSKEKRAEQAELSGVTLNISQGDAPVIAAPVIPPQQNAPQVKTITVTDSGIWPYLTGLFALAWLVTLGFWLRARRIPHANENFAATERPAADCKALIAAVKARDGVKAQALLTEWLTQSPVLSDQQREAICRELQQMQASLYAPEAQAQGWSDKQLIKLLKQAGRGVKCQPTEQVLEEL